MLMPKKTCDTFCENWISGILAGVHPPALLDAVDEPLDFVRGADQLVDEPVERRVLGQRLIEPAGDLLAAAVDVAGPL